MTLTYYIRNIQHFGGNHQCGLQEVVSSVGSAHPAITLHKTNSIPRAYARGPRRLEQVVVMLYDAVLVDGFFYGDRYDIVFLQTDDLPVQSFSRGGGVSASLMLSLNLD